MPALRLSNRSPLALSGRLLTAALVAFRLLPGLARPGMFFDGVTHAAIARNMAEGIGDFWHPIFSPADGAGYHEQPPLGFWLESLCFRALGDHFWVEKLYSAVVALATAVAIAAIWRRLTGERVEMRSLDWLPVALWTTILGWGWMYGNNMLENTLGLFTTLAVYFILRASDGPMRAGVVRRAGWLAAAAACILAAVLSKGPVGLFPLATPLAIYFTLGRKSFAGVVAECGALVAVVAAAFGLVLLNPAASDYLIKYLHEQLFASLAGHREVVGSALGRFDIVWKMIRELAVPTAIAGLLLFAASRRGFLPLKSNVDRRAMVLCLAIAASASLPIIASPKQSGHYAFPSYAFYALAIAFWCAPAVGYLVAGESTGATGQRNGAQRSESASAGAASRQKLFWWLAAALLLAAIIMSCASAGRPQRDADVYCDTQALGQLLPRAAVVGLTEQLADDYPLLTNLARWDFIGAERSMAGHEFVLAAADGAIPTGFSKVPAQLTRYRLLQRTTVAAQSASSKRADSKR